MQAEKEKGTKKKRKENVLQFLVTPIPPEGRELAGAESRQRVHGMPIGLVPEPVIRVHSGLEGLAVGERGGRDAVGIDVHGGHTDGAVGDGRVCGGEGDVSRRGPVPAGDSSSSGTDPSIVGIGQDEVGAEVEDVLAAVGLGDLVRGEAGLNGEDGA